MLALRKKWSQTGASEEPFLENGHKGVCSADKNGASFFSEWAVCYRKDNPSGTQFLSSPSDYSLGHFSS